MNNFSIFQVLRGTRRSVIGVSVIGFLSGLVFCTPMGYKFAIDVFGKGLISWNIMVFTLLEVLLVGWIFGIDKFMKMFLDMDLPIGLYVEMYLKYTMKFLLPLTLLFLLFGNAFLFEDKEEEMFPHIMANLLTFTTVIFVPIGKYTAGQKI